MKLKSKPYTAVHTLRPIERDKRIAKLKSFDKAYGINAMEKTPAYLFVPVSQWKITPDLRTHLELRQIDTLNKLRLYNLSDIENQPEQGRSNNKFAAKLRSELKKFVDDNGGWFYEDHQDRRTIDIQMTKGEVLTATGKGIANGLNPAPQPS